MTGRFLRILKELLQESMEICNPPLSPFKKGGFMYRLREMIE
jgi:hypothetical protein